MHSTGIVGSGNGGNYLADFAEGQIFQYNQTNIQAEPNLYFYNIAGYVQDHWRLTPRLTVDVGIRLEHMTPWQDAHGIGVGVFSAADYANGVNSNILPGITWHGLDKSVPLGGRPTRAVFVEPRGGFAWDVAGTGNTVVRGGAGLYRAHDSYNDADSQQESTIGQRTYTASGPLTLSSVSSLQGFVSKNGGFVPDSNAYAFDRNDDETPRVFTYNLAIDQRFPGHMLAEFAYVGNRSDKLLNDGSTQNTTLDNINTLPIGALFGPQPGTGVVFPFFQPGGTGNNNYVGGLSQGQIDSFKKFPKYNHLFVPEHSLSSNYNGLQVALTRQSGHGTFNVNYTFSKALGNLGIGGSSTYSYPGDPINLANDYNMLPFDRRHIFNASYSYVFGNPVHNRLLGEVANGWELSGITNYQSGQNLQSIISSNFGLTGNITVPVGSIATVGNNTSTCQTTSGTGTCSIGVSSTNILGTPDVNLQPTLIGDPQIKNSYQSHINPGAFSLPQLGTNGPYRYGAEYGPGFFDTDITAAKAFKVSDHSNIQLRVAAFNFINHANNTFSTTNTSNQTLMMNSSYNGNVASALATSRTSNATGINAFGTTAIRTGRRVMELGLRYDF